MGPGTDARDFLAGMFENCPDAIFLMRLLPSGRLIYESVNPAWELATGVPSSKAIGASPEELFAPEAAAQLSADRRRCLEQGTPLTTEEELLFPTGPRQWQTHLVPMSGELVAGFARDISGLRQTENALREAEARWRTLAESAPIYIFTLDRKGRFLSLNRRTGSLDMEFLAGVPAVDLCQPEFKPQVEQAIRRVFQKRRTARLELRASAPNRPASWFDCTIGPLISGGRVTAAIGTAINITKRKDAERALAERERRFRALVENSWDGVTLLDHGGNILSTTPATTRLLGYSPEDLIGVPIAHYIHPEDSPRMLDLLSALADTPGGRVTAKCRMLHKEGTWRWFESSATNLLHDPNVAAIVVNYRDITDRHRWDAAARALDRGVSGVTGQAFFQALVRHLSQILDMAHARVVEFTRPDRRRARTVAVWEDGRLLANHEYDVAGTPCERVEAEEGLCVPRDVRQRFPGVPPLEALAAESYIGVPLRDSAGATIGFVALIDRKPLESAAFAESLVRLVASRVAAELVRFHAEQALRASEQRLRLVIDQAPVILWTTDAELRVLSTMGAGLATAGVAPDAEAGQKLEDLIEPGETDPIVIERHRRALAGETVFGEAKSHGRRYETVVQPFRDAEGHIVGCLGVAVDITERTVLQDQLRQAQKMEAVGRLAGGVAHDFNNLLTVISGYSSFLLESLPEGSPSRSYAEQVAQAATRAAQLTAQLLAFGRKQMLQPHIIDINSLVSDAEKMLRRLIGEDVELITDLQPDIGCIMADPGQLYQVILNLVVNARDAMPHGGHVTVSTADVAVGEEEAKLEGEVKPGGYVMLSVADTGHGMSPDVKAHLFEPFFTTKEMGKGTGLGLPTAYGIVKQSGGHIAVESEVGRGTTFRVYLPRIEGKAEGEAVQRVKTTKGKETVLLVEDEGMVRQFARSALEQAGYKVMEAVNGQDALRTIQESPARVDIVITDVVMPEMGGRELTGRISHVRPGLPVLFVSGYADDATPSGEVLPSGADCLRKPFKAHELTAKVREVLDRARAA